MKPHPRTLRFLVILLMLWACENDPGKTADNGNGNDDSDTTGDTSSNGSDPDGTDPIIIPDGCGDGELADNEACDDGNNVSGDGCAADCSHVELGWSCYPPGAPCQRVAVCGDGIVVPPEQCDDGNLTRGDGCSDLCQVEIGFKCEGSPSVCTPTVCGDGIVEGAEGCDDGNTLPFDGCDAQCQLEPVCVGGGSCTSSCGDGLVMGAEECDDGNNIDGDGCSSDCRIEPGYTCIQPQIEGVLKVPIVYKDFDFSHPDFENNTMGCSGAAEGMLESTLGLDGNPVFRGNVGGCGYASRFHEWYDYAPLPSGQLNPSVVISTLKLFDNGQGGYVNRWGPNGEPWIYKRQVQWGDWIGCSATPASDCSSCAGIDGYDPDNGWLCDTACDKWIAGLEGGNIQYRVCAAPDGSTPVDGNPFFFPIDGLGTSPQSEYQTAATGPIYTGGGGYMGESEAITAFGLTVPAGYLFSHNFAFTSQVRFWFQYDENTPQRLDFLGDDDVWVFINNQLVLDLGGIHEAAEGTVNVNALNLTQGQIYEIVVLQAERQTNGSSYRLTLSGFNTARSECRPMCGDGIVGLGEECDDGVNEGGYGKCGPGCKWGARCGDGILQEEFGEHCDDGLLNGRPGKCPTSCRLIDID